MSKVSGIVPDLLDVSLHAGNVSELDHFYSKLGLRKAVDDDDLKVYILGVNELEIHRAERARQEEVTIQVKVGKIEPVEQILQREEIAYHGPQNDERGLSVQLHDPNGNIVRFVESDN